MNLIPLEFLSLLEQSNEHQVLSTQESPFLYRENLTIYLSSYSTSLPKSKHEENVIKIETKISASTVSIRDLCLLLTFCRSPLG